MQIRDNDNAATSECNIRILMLKGKYIFIGGSDYVSGRYVVTIPAGQITFPFDVPITNDTLLESNEDFDLIITTRDLPDRVTRGDPSRTTVTILDDDSK